MSVALPSDELISEINGKWLINSLHGFLSDTQDGAFWDYAFFMNK
jgi:hypothetical protein